MKAKEFLRSRGVPFDEQDVSRNPTAARELARQSGQMGVPVITGGGQVIVGFDQPRLERLVQQVHGGAGSGFRLGASVRSVAGGAEVGAVRAGSAAERGGIRPGDVIVAIAGQPVASAGDVEDAVRRAPAGQAVEVEVVRDGRRMQLTVPSR